MARLLVEIDAELRRELKARLAREGITLKTWVSRSARAYVDAWPPTRVSGGSPASAEPPPLAAARSPRPPDDDFLD